MNQFPLNTTLSDISKNVDFRLVANGATYIVVIGVEDEWFEYELYEYGSEILDGYRSLYYVFDNNSIMLHDPETCDRVAKFMFKTRGRDPYISFAFLNIKEISESPLYYHNSATLGLCPWKFVRAWNDIAIIDDKYYMYKCDENNYSYKFSYEENGVNIEELFVLGTFEEQLL